ncbi:hypothetical protein RIF29_38328 [Crotalaria pallida]|uniref:Uncharacterized protein n=1 Tax=Crotalaria pallida TaxID=3830 RepID=A0AAN9DZ04_CROPI
MDELNGVDQLHLDIGEHDEFEEGIAYENDLIEEADELNGVNQLDMELHEDAEFEEMAGRGKGKGKGKAISQPSTQHTITPTTNSQIGAPVPNFQPHLGEPSSRSSNHPPAPMPPNSARSSPEHPSIDLESNPPPTSSVQQLNDVASSSSEIIRWGRKDADGRTWIKSAPNLK